MGLQHRKTGGSRHWVSSKDSVLSWFQNATGSIMWPTDRDKVRRIVTEFEAAVKAAEEVGEYREKREGMREKNDVETIGKRPNCTREKYNQESS